jgi:hypothetical protein
MLARSLPGDQGRQVERLDEADVADLPRRRLGDEQVVVLERSLEDRARVALRGRRSSSPGPRRLYQSKSLCGFATKCRYRKRDRLKYEADPEGERAKSRAYYAANRERIIARVIEARKRKAASA